jgi:hypothetical protein
VDRTDFFMLLVDRIYNILKVNKDKNFYFVVAKEVLLRTIALAIPTYTMSVFKLPKQVIK